MTTARQQIIEATYALLEKQSYYATGINQILANSGVPKASINYYFPDGMEELISETIKQAGETLAERVRINLSLEANPAEAVRRYAHIIAKSEEASGFLARNPLTSIAMETATTSPLLNLACREAFTRIQIAFDEKLIENGYPTESASKLATLITAAIEGGIILSRTYHNGDLLRQIGDSLAEIVQKAGPS